MSNIGLAYSGLLAVNIMISNNFDKSYKNYLAPGLTIMPNSTSSDIILILKSKGILLSLMQ